MKKILPSCLLMAALISGVLLSHPTAQVRAEAAWQILFNGSPSKLTAIETDGGPMIPVYFPIPEEGEKQAYGVQLENDPVAMQLRIKRIKKKSPVRARGDCPACEGDKKCRDCYPAGAGVGISGEACYLCNGSGECYSCGGSGVCYTCDGNGLSGGCSTCGEVSD